MEPTKRANPPEVLRAYKTLGYTCATTTHPTRYERGRCGPLAALYLAHDKEPPYTVDEWWHEWGMSYLEGFVCGDEGVVRELEGNIFRCRQGVNDKRAVYEAMAHEGLLYQEGGL